MGYSGTILFPGHHTEKNFITYSKTTHEGICTSEIRAPMFLTRLVGSQGYAWLPSSSGSLGHNIWERPLPGHLINKLTNISLFSSAVVNWLRLSLQPSVTIGGTYPLDVIHTRIQGSAEWCHDCKNHLEWPLACCDSEIYSELTTSCMGISPPQDVCNRTTQQTRAN
jgi:hypothetical protein